MLSVDEQMKIIMKGVSELVSEEDLREKLKRCVKERKQLTVKLGLDPSAPDIHLGHTVVLRKIRQLQDLGHKAVIIIGDFTGKIGDPTGRSRARKQLTDEQVMENARTYETQIRKILDPDKLEMRYNSEWLGALNFADVINLAAKVTVARMLERDDFEKRYNSNQPISLHEFFYPLMQAYDSVFLKADIELGGTDQKFNILMGRNLQKQFGQESQSCIFLPLLEGTDGVEKMSKSFGNYIGINEEPNVIYQKVMTIPDNMIVKYYELVTDVHPDEINRIAEQLSSDTTNPRDIKMGLAFEITRLYHGEQAAKKAQEYFIGLYQKGRAPEDTPLFTVTDEERNAEGEIDLVKIMVKNGLAASNSEARRLITQNALKLDGEKYTAFTIPDISGEMLIQVGKAKFLRINK